MGTEARRMGLLERAAKSPLCLANAKLEAFKAAPERRSDQPQLVCESGEDAERYFAVLDGGHGYSLLHEGESFADSGEMRRKVDIYTILAGECRSEIGSAETYRDPQGKILILAFEVKAGELVPISMIARSLEREGP